MLSHGTLQLPQIETAVTEAVEANNYIVSPKLTCSVTY